MVLLACLGNHFILLTSLLSMEILRNEYASDLEVYSIETLPVLTFQAPFSNIPAVELFCLCFHHYIVEAGNEISCYLGCDLGGLQSFTASSPGLRCQRNNHLSFSPAALGCCVCERETQRVCDRSCSPLQPRSLSNARSTQAVHPHKHKLPLSPSHQPQPLSVP